MRYPLFVFCLITVLSLPSISLAAALYIDPSATTVKKGNSVTLSVRLDTDEENEECINAVRGVITYGAGVDPVDISTGDSILSVWVEDPTIDKEARTITFAGGIPNGYCGRVPGDPRLTNNIVDLVFRAPGFTIGQQQDADSATVNVEVTAETEAFVNDGFGTKADLARYGSVITLSPETGRGENDAWLNRVDQDDRPPEEFSIRLERDQVGGAFSGKWFIVFNTEDKQTGVDHYEVIEESFAERGLFGWGAADAPWIVARSPYVLEDQTLNSTIRVKALDKAGNSYIATLVPDRELRTLTSEQYVVYGLGIVGLLVLIGAIAFVYLYWRRLHKKEVEADIEDDIDNKNALDL